VLLVNGVHCEYIFQVLEGWIRDICREHGNANVWWEKVTNKQHLAPFSVGKYVGQLRGGGESVVTVLKQ
jgi:hypothetical protein